METYIVAVVGAVRGHGDVDVLIAVRDVGPPVSDEPGAQRQVDPPALLVVEIGIVDLAVEDVEAHGDRLVEEVGLGEAEANSS